MTQSDPSPVFAILTPAGRGAIATICCHGTGALDLVASVFRPASAVTLHNRIGSMVYGNWAPNGQTGEDLVVLPFADDHVEVHCHGGWAAADEIGKTLTSLGLRRLEAKLMARRLATHPWIGDMDWAIGSAMTQKTAKIMLRQRSLLPRYCQQLARQLSKNELDSVRSDVLSIVQWLTFGERLLSPWLVVLCGQPNVGKSSLINALCGFQRAIVHPTPGTTRDIVSQITALDGWPVQLADTAGIRQDASQLEGQGIEMARQIIAQADLVVAVVDNSIPGSDEENQFVTQLNAGLVVLNKSDLPDATGKPVGLHVSAADGTGISELATEIVRNLIPENPPHDQPIPFVEEHVAFFRELAAAIECDDHDRAGRLLNEAGFGAESE